MARLPFVDAHVHLWDLHGAIRYPWLTPPFDDGGANGSVQAIAIDYSLDDYFADADGWDIGGLIHIDAGADPAHALDETRWLQAMADARGLPSAIVAFAALDDPAVDRLLEAHAGHANVCGIRHIVNWHADPRRTYSAADATRDPQWERGFGRLARHGLSFDLQCYPDQMPHIAEIAARHPDVPVILNHAGMPVLADLDGQAAWHRGVTALAALPHVSVKLSGFGFIQHAWTVETMRPLMLTLIDLFGPQRVMLASDFPTDKLFAGFGRCLDALDAITGSFSESERRAMFAGNATRIYRLDLPNAVA